MKFNLYHFEGYGDIIGFDDLLAPGHGYTKHDGGKVSIPGISYEIYFKNGIITSPDYLEFVNDVIDPSIQLGKQSCSLVILVKLNREEKFFALTFGASWGKVNKKYIVSDFGLKTVLNLIGGERITGVDTKKLGPNTKEKRTVFTKSTRFDLFGVDEIEELLTHLEGKPIDQKYGVRLSGKDSLSFFLSLKSFDFNSIPNQVLSYYNYYCKDDYKKNYGFIDNYKIVSNKSFIEKLDIKLIEYIENTVTGFDNISVGIPSLLDNLDVYNLCIDGIDGVTDVLDEKQIIPKLATLIFGKGDKIKLLKSLGVTGTRYDKEGEISVFKLYDCLNFELVEREGTFVLNDGKWNIVNNDFIGDINSEINRIPFYSPDKNDNYSCSVQFIPFDGSKHYELKTSKEGKKKIEESENVYNQHFAKNIGGVLLDCNTFSKLPGSSKIEVCDVLYEKYFIHVKRGLNSSVLSHLFNQAYVSAILFKMHPAYVKDINDKGGKLNQEDLIEVFLGIVDNRKDFIQKIPFFSKITLWNLFKRVSSMNIKLNIVQILDKTDSTTLEQLKESIAKSSDEPIKKTVKIKRKV